MNCQTAQKIMQDYLDRRLVVLDRNEFVRHVSLCSGCEREVTAYREVFTFLRRPEPAEVPRGLQNAIISQLKAQGLIHQPKVSSARRRLDAFFGLPGMVRYPAAAAVLIAAMYLPLMLILGSFEEFVGKATVVMTDMYLFLQGALGDVAFLTRLSDVAGYYTRAISTIFGALSSLLSSAGGNLLPLSVIIIAALSAGFTILRIIRKRSSHDAPYSF